MPHRHTPPVLPTLFPVEEARRDWTETASLIVAAIGTGYFSGHLIVAGVRAVLS